MIRASIRRPVAVVMVYATVSLMGLAAWKNIPVEYLPNTSFPRLTISLRWPGTSPETMEAFATAPVEASVQQVKGVQRITSTTNESQATIQVEFQRDVDMDFVRLDLSERLSVLEEELPDGVQPLQLTPYIPANIQSQAQRPFLNYVFSGPLLLEALQMHLEDVIKPQLLQIKGVADVTVVGGSRREIEIEMNPDRLASLGLTPGAVRQAINSLEIVKDLGAVRDGTSEWTVAIRNRAETMKEIRELILPLPAGRSATPVTLEDVAEIRDTFQEPTGYFRINKSPAVNMVIEREPGTNAVRLAETVKARVEELESLNPPGTGFDLTADLSDDIRRELTDLRTRALVSAAVIFLVLLLFLRSFATTAVVFSTIVFSILISLNLIYFGGLSINLMTIMGVALGFGLVVDNAIVVLENMYRKWQDGVEAFEAAQTGSREVVLAIMASAGTTLIVFLPFLYLQGELRVYYLPLAIVVALTLVASIFVSFTFIPSWSARVLKRATERRKAKEARRAAAAGFAFAEGQRSEEEASGSGESRESPQYASNRAALETSRSPAFYTRFYSGLLAWTLRFPWVTVFATLAIFVATGWLFNEKVPRGRVFGGGSGQTRSWVDVRITMPRGADLARMDELTRYFEDHLATMPEVETFETNVYNGTSSYIRVSFPEELELTAVPLVIEEQLRSYSFSFTGADVRVYGQGPAFYGGSGASNPNVRITIYGYNYLALADIAEDLGSRLSQLSRVTEMDTNATGGFQRDRAVEFVATIDRDAVQRHQISVAEATQLVAARLSGGGVRNTINLAGEPIGYELKLEGYRQIDVDALLSTVVTTSRGIRVPVSDFIDVTQRNVLTSILRENQQYQRTVAYEFRGPTLLSNFYRDKAMATTVLPPGYSMKTTTPSLISAEEAAQINLVLMISLGLIFMVTAALFESIRQPLVVLLTVPMALIGVFLIFFFMRATFTREAYIGVIMMGGVVVNHAILLIDHINRVRREPGVDVFNAIVKGTLERVRPILMTTATTVLGLLPLVMFMPTSDARLWNAMTYALIGGLLSSTLLVLTTTPCLYLLFERIGKVEWTREWAELRWGGVEAMERRRAVGVAAPTLGDLPGVVVGAGD